MEKYEEVTFTRNQINKLIDVVDQVILRKRIKIREVSSGKGKLANAYNQSLCNDLIDILKEEQDELEVILEVLKQAWHKY